MNNLQVLHKQMVLGNEFTMYGTMDEPYFLAKDAAVWIGHSNTSKMVKDAELDESEVTIALCEVTNSYSTSKARKTQSMTFLTEDGLYEVLMQSRKPIAKQFKKEVKHILKNIRKHGGHLTDKKIQEALADPDVLIELATKIKTERNKRLAAEQSLFEAERTIVEQQPKVTFADSVTASNTSILVREFAKVLKQNGVDTGEKKLFSWLRRNGYLIKSGSADYNTPTQKAMDMGLFEVQQTTINRSNGAQIKRTSKITGKGQMYFVNKFLGGIE